MFGCRRFTTSRREAQTMASHLQATAGSIGRAQQKTQPIAHTVYLPTEEFPQPISSNANGVVVTSTCSAQAVAQQTGSSHEALLCNEDQQSPVMCEADTQPLGGRQSLRCHACACGDAAAERARSWYGQRTWSRATAVQQADSNVATPHGSPQAAAQGTDAVGASDLTASKSASPQAQAWRFSVMCYNILADTYAQYFAYKLYGDVPRHYLDWHHRLRLLVEEIRHWGPDVVCLQEVQHYQDLEPELQAAGYEGRFMRRTGRRRDGCATFWRADRFRACSLERLDFAPLGLEDNVAMMLSLAPRAEAVEGAGLDSGTVAAISSSVRLLVATTHITFDPAKGDVKLGQVRTLLSRAASLAENPPPDDPHALEHYHQHHQQNYQHQYQHLMQLGPDSGRNLRQSQSCHHDLHQHQYSRLHHHSNSAHRQQHQQQQQQHRVNNCQQKPAPDTGINDYLSVGTEDGSSNHLQGAWHSLPGQDQDQNRGREQGRDNPCLPGAQPRPQHRLLLRQSLSASDVEAAATKAAASPLPLRPSLPSSAAAAANAAAVVIEGRRHKPPVVPRPGPSGGGVAAVDAAVAAAGTGAGAAATTAATAGAAVAAAAGGPQKQQQQLQTLAIITGDFNSTAGSPLYQFVARGSLDLALTNRKKLSGQLHGVCHTQYKPVSEVKQLHAQLAAATAAAGPGAGGAKPDARDCAGGNSPVNALAVTAVGASPPGTPPSTPSVTAASAAAAAAAADASAWSRSRNGFRPNTATAQVSIVQRLAAAAMDSAAATISACTAAAFAAAAQPALACPAARDVAAKVLDNILHSATGSHRSSGIFERWSEKELHSAMGDQYDAAAVQRSISGGGAAFPPSRVLTPQPASPPAIADGGDGGAAADSSTQPPSASHLKLGRLHHPPSASRHRLEGDAAMTASGAADYLSRCSLELDSDPATASASLGSTSSPLVVRHPLQLKSSYVEVARAEPAFTSIHSGFMGTVDFIWYTTDSILQQQQQQPLPLPLQRSLRQLDELQADAVSAAAVYPPPPPMSTAAAGRAEEGELPSAPSVVPSSSYAAATAAAVVPYGGGCHGFAESESAAQQQQQPHESSRPCPVMRHCGYNTVAMDTSDNGTATAAAPVRRFQLVPVAVLQPPDLELLPRGLPAAGWGSDHISVMTEFELRPL